MKKLLFLRRDGVYLPEINAYLNYLRDKMLSVQAYDSSQLSGPPVEADFDIIWKFMGFDRGGRSEGFVVHEYGSLSVGHFPRAKNIIKRASNVKPSLRVFLNEAVHEEMGFKDGIRYHLRDMGVSPHFFRDSPNPNPEFDFVYSGSLNRGKIIHSMLDHFKTKMKGVKLLVVGAVPDEIQQMFGETSNISFTGKLKYEDVPNAITQAKYGLNIMPDIYPFNIQTSTKVLEYCAAAMPVISTSYEWINGFERRSNGTFFYINNHFDNLTMSNVENFQFSVPSMDGYEWDTVIDKSQLFDFLK